MGGDLGGSGFKEELLIRLLQIRFRADLYPAGEGDRDDRESISIII